MFETDNKVYDKIFNKKSPQTKLREKNKTALSEYKFKLRPINGKSI